MFKLEIIDGKGIFLNGVKIEPVIDWAVESDGPAQIVTLRLQVDELKMDCGCRKPKPGMLLKAARDFNIDLAASWMIFKCPG